MAAFGHGRRDPLDSRLRPERSRSCREKHRFRDLSSGNTDRDLDSIGLLLIEVVACVTLFSFLNFGGTVESVIKTYRSLAGPGAYFLGHIQRI